jgi:hypothetical protein
MAAFSCVSDYSGRLTCPKSSHASISGLVTGCSGCGIAPCMDPFTCQKSSRPAFLEAFRLLLGRAEASGWHRSK